MKLLKKIFSLTAILFAALFFSNASFGSSTCFQGDTLFSAAKKSGEILFGFGYISPTEKDPYSMKVSMMYDRKTAEWSFLVTNNDNDTTCFIEGGKGWTKLPYVFPPGTVQGGEYEEHVGRCDSFENLSEKLLVNNHKIDIGYGPQPIESFPENSGIEKQETHFFIDGVGGFATVYTTTYIDKNTPSLACIQASGFGWKFLDYYETHLPPIGK
jgi:hypothetical protein